MPNEDRNAVARATKNELRRAVRVRIATMTRDERERADAAVCARLAELARELDVSFAVAYLALADEVNVDGFLASLVERGVAALLPRVTAAGVLGLGAWRPTTHLSRDLEGVPAPVSTVPWPKGRGLLVVPGRVFDTEGGRVGRGLGYYDRFLGAGQVGAMVAGVAYESQVVPRVPREPHDTGVDCLVTEERVRRFPATSRK